MHLNAQDGCQEDKAGRDNHGRVRGRMHEHVHGLHSHASATNVLAASLAATCVLVVAELIAGFSGHSIALISDAAHNLMDLPMLVISWLATRWAMRPPTAEKTYGYHRAGILAAFVNAMAIIFVAAFVIFESVTRLRHPVAVHAMLMLWIALLALVINGGITLAVRRGRGDLNVRTVWLHNLGDALSNVAVFGGALAIHWTDAGWIDPLLGIGIGAAVLWSATGILRESGHILLEGLPRDIRLGEVAQAILSVVGVQEVHDVHIWTLGANLNALSCHVRIPDMHMEESERILAGIRDALTRDFSITHTTIQFERAGLPADAGLYMPAPAPRRGQ
ncbi:MAG TPA: cation diffusion facilitator family transporter [Candidatus Acidoferrales bacterium]|nr:cation diffusion facilitator family transporter [Candidatus Acidoferrales bacterium]